MIGPLAVLCSHTFHYQLSVKIALLSSGPASCRGSSCLFIVFLWQSHQNTCLVFFENFLFGGKFSFCVRYRDRQWTCSKGHCFPHALGRVALWCRRISIHTYDLMLSWFRGRSTLFLQLDLSYCPGSSLWLKFRNPGSLVFINAFAVLHVGL